MVTFSNSDIRILIFGHKEFSQLISSVLSEFESQAEFRIVDAIIGTIDEANAHIQLFSPDIVISAGSNAAYLKAALDVPVLAMTVTEADIIGAITTASNVGNDIHLITFDDYSRLVTLLNATTSLKITHQQYATATEAKQSYHLAQLSKNQVLVGASLVCGLAAQDGIKSFLMYSRESCRTLLNDAIRLGKKQKASIHIQAMQRWLFKDSKTPIVVFDGEMNLITSNQAAKRDLGDSLGNEQQIIQSVHNNNMGDASDGSCRINNADWFFHKDRINLANRHFEVYQFYSQNPNLHSQSKQTLESYELVYQSTLMQDLITRTDLYAKSPSHILIIGESGTGKEMVARRIHQHSLFSHGKFVAINCAAMPSELFEGELFGYVDGSFTGSRRGGKHGLLYEAQGGVLFLDEIGELSLPLQAKLLRVIQEKTYRPIGSHKEFKVKLKIVAATNKDLATQVEDGAFRNDLYYRLNVLSLHIPPLTARREDLPLITMSKLNSLNYGALEAKQLDEIARQLEPIFDVYQWPGNIRELENILERLLVYCNADHNVIKGSIASLLTTLAPELFYSPSEENTGVLAENEIQLVNQAMQQFNGNKERVAQFLGISQTTLWRRLKRINQNKQRGQHHA